MSADFTELPVKPGDLTIELVDGERTRIVHADPYIWISEELYDKAVLGELRGMSVEITDDYDVLTIADDFGARFVYVLGEDEEPAPRGFYAARWPD